MIDNITSNIVFLRFKPFTVDYTAYYSYTNKDFVNEPIIKSGGNYGPKTR